MAQMTLAKNFPILMGYSKVLGNTHINWTLQFKQNLLIRKSQVNDQCVGHVGTMMISSFGAKIPQFLRGQAVTFFNVRRDSLMVSSVVTRFIITITY